MTPAQPGRMKIGVISAGRVGAVLAAALRSQGHQVVGAYATSEASVDRLETLLPDVPALAVEEIVEQSQLVLLAVPDDQLAGLVNGLAALHRWKPGQIVVHTAGRYGYEVLEPAAELGALTLAIHPAMTFTGTSLDLRRLPGTPFALSAPAPIQAIGLALIAEMEGEAVVLGNADRQLYHLALSHGANHVVTVIAQAMRILEGLGIDDPGAFLRPLVQASVDGALSSGDALLTGPVARGDVGTVAEHLQALAELPLPSEDAQDVEKVYRAVATASTNRMERARRIGSVEANALRALLEA